MVVMINSLTRINIKKYMRLHEKSVLKALQEPTNLDRIEKEHMKQIHFI